VGSIIWALCRDNPQSIGVHQDGLNGKYTPFNTDADYTLHQALRIFDFWNVSLAVATSTFYLNWSTNSYRRHSSGKPHICIANPFNIFRSTAVISAVSGVLFSNHSGSIFDSLLSACNFFVSTNAVMMFFLWNILPDRGGYGSLFSYSVSIGHSTELSMRHAGLNFLAEKYLGRIMSSAIVPSVSSSAKRNFGSYFVLMRVSFLRFCNGFRRFHH
jgi:hypothetical protein